jgi:hypothetical protein
MDIFGRIHGWFDESLECIPYGARYASFDQIAGEGRRQNALLLDQALSELGTGIDGLGWVELPHEMLPGILQLEDNLLPGLAEGEVARLRLPPDDVSAIVARRGGKLVMENLVAYHPKAGGGRAKLDTWQESDGAKRLIDLLPIFLWNTSPGSNKVFAIDGLDKDLDTPTARRLLGYFLSQCSKDTRAQLLFSTRDALLMDQDLLRLDEMWVTERFGDGASRLTPMLIHERAAPGAAAKPRQRDGLGGVPGGLLDMVFGGKPKG